MTTVSYCFTPLSPWSYLGHDRFVDLARRSAAQVRVLPVDYGRVFPVSGGLPLAQRAAQRQAYRLVELQRFSEHLGVPIRLHPRYFPADPTAASRLIVAVDEAEGPEAALRLSGHLMRAVWAEDRNVADEATLAEITAACGLPPARLVQAREEAVELRYAANTQWAIDIGVFGAPSYVVDGEIFWGQDRLDFLARRLGVA